MHGCGEEIEARLALRQRVRPHRGPTRRAVGDAIGDPASAISHLGRHHCDFDQLRGVGFSRRPRSPEATCSASPP